MSGEDIRKEPCAPFLDSSDWKYVGEGGKHAIFVYRPRDGASERLEWVGLLLRIDKVDIARAAATDGAIGYDGLLRVPPDSHRSGFQELVYSRLRPYIDLPERIVLNWKFVSNLRTTTLDDDSIPDRRRHNWSTEVKSDEGVTGKYTPIGNLLNDYRLSSSGCRDRSVSIEIKPKAGYKAISPLVRQGRIGKYTQPRFELMQRLYCEGRLTKDWMDSSDGPFRTSTYDPLDLFSGDAVRVRRALDCLISYPQNNLKIWVGDKLVLGAGVVKNQDACFDWRAVSEVLRSIASATCDEVDETHVSSLLMTMTTSVLLEEPFLLELHALQKLDILDADGAIDVYNHLVRLCGGDLDKADCILDDFLESPTPTRTLNGSPPHPCLDASPLPPPETSINLEALCAEIDASARLLVSSHPQLPTLTHLNRARMRALDLVERLSVDECCYILQIWLLSLTMCDLSFFVTYRERLLEDDSVANKPQDMPPAGPSWCRIMSQQKRGSAGCLAFRSNPRCSAFDGLLLYELKAIDVDRKPARKLRSRHIKEAYFDTN